MGIEPTTLGFTNRCSNQLSYAHRRAMRAAILSPGLLVSGLPGGTRTHNPQLRRLVLYPVELRAAAGQNLVGVERFELPTSCSQSKRATRLRYTPENGLESYSARRAGAISFIGARACFLL